MRPLSRRLAPRRSAGLPPAFWWLFAGQGLSALATFVFPFLALYLRSRGLAPGAIGLVTALFGAGSLPAGPLAGNLADRLGRRPTLLGALLGSAALTALLPLFASPVALALDVLALGLAVHAYFPAMNAAVADLLPPERYADAYGLLYWERNAGLALSFVAGGALAARGYGRLFLADAASTALFALLVWWRVAEPRPPTPGSGAPGTSPGFAAALGDRHLVRLIALQVGLLLAMFQFMVALPVAMAARGFGPPVYGRTMAVNGLLIALFQPWASRIARGRDEGHLLALAALLVGAGTGAYALCRTPAAFAGATAVWSLGEILTLPTLSAVVSRLAPPELRGRYQGLLGFGFAAGLTLAPAIGGAVLGWLGATALWAGTATLGAAVAAGHLVAGRSRPRLLGPS